MILIILKDLCGRTENAIFNSDRSIPPIQVFQYNQNHNNTDLERKKKERFPFLLTPAEKECGEGRKGGERN